jgi:aspartyl-tRNA(Asn)/glutamyl-tRNA(Gln) amidotransferase subunit A
MRPSDTRVARSRDDAAPHSRIEALPAALAMRSISQVELVELALARIAEVDGRVSAFVHVDADGARRAARMGSNRSAGSLTGVTLGVKDIIEVGGLPTRYGSTFLSRTPRQDAPVVRRLRAAGAIVVGKTKTTAFAYADPADTVNPWATDHTPGGSSSGSAAAVAADMVLAALGTQTAGSVLRPASYCGVVGFVPSPNRVNRGGVFPCSASFDRVGFFARSVAGAGLLANAASNGGWQVSEPHALRVGTAPWLTTLASAAMQRAVDEATRSLVAGGAVAQEVAAPLPLDDARRIHRTIMSRETADVHAAMFATHRAEYPARLADLVREGSEVERDTYLDAVARRNAYRTALNDAMRGVDVLVCPAALGAAEPSLETTGDPAMNVTAMLADLPTITVPVAFDDDGLPLGVQIMAARMRDADVLAAATIVESRLTP